MLQDILSLISQNLLFIFGEVYCDSEDLEEINRLLSISEPAQEGSGYNYSGPYTTLEEWLKTNQRFNYFHPFTDLDELTTKMTKILNPFYPFTDPNNTGGIFYVRRTDIDLNDLYLVSTEVGHDIYLIFNEAVEFIQNNREIFSNPSKYTPLPIPGAPFL
jgi:hypothetical protein